MSGDPDCLSVLHTLKNHSVLILRTGFSLAFFQHWNVTVSTVMRLTSRKEATNTQARIGVLSEKLSSQSCPIHQPKGTASTKQTTNITK